MEDGLSRATMHLLNSLIVSIFVGTSLLERLWNTYKNLYEDDPNYITVLVKNFRSDADILRIPNELFYWEKPLQVGTDAIVLR